MPDLKMPQLNDCKFTGRLARQSDLQTAAGGAAFARNALAITDGYGDKKKTYWIDFTAFGKVAEKLVAMPKGCPVIITQSKLTIDEYEKEQGMKIKKPVLLVYAIESLTWDNDATDTSSAPPRSPQPPASTENDDIPF